MTKSPNRFVLMRSSVPVFTSIEDERIDLVEKSILYPNPTVRENTLSFHVSNNQFVSVRIYSSNSALIKELTSQFFSEGKYTLIIESDLLPQGFFQIEINKGGSKTFWKFIKM